MSPWHLKKLMWLINLQCSYSQCFQSVHSSNLSCCVSHAHQLRIKSVKDACLAMVMRFGVYNEYPSLKSNWQETNKRIFFDIGQLSIISKYERKLVFKSFHPQHICQFWLTVGFIRLSTDHFNNQSIHIMMITYFNVLSTLSVSALSELIRRYPLTSTGGHQTGQSGLKTPSVCITLLKNCENHQKKSEAEVILS